MRNVTMTGKDVGSFEACNRIAELVMAKDAICQVQPCSFNGVYQPSILETFAQGNVLLLSYFYMYDRLAPFYPADSARPALNVASLAVLARDVCAGPAAWAKAAWGADSALREELEGRPEWCLDLTFMHALLRLGYEFDAARPVRIEKQIEGTELGWCLGATIAIVGGELTCIV
ncbi:guanosine-diphosphatase [Phellopilus nigrolimitatus]|nr:guanosine-diphosphatase [Phellopilus nigrolimitatus]